MGIPQEGYLKGAGADHFCVLQENRSGRQFRKSRRILLGYAESKSDLNQATIVNVNKRCINISPWDQMGFTQGYWGSWQKRLPSHFPFPLSWITWEVPDEWRLVNVMLIYKKGWMEDLGNCKHVSLISVLRKVMEQIILSEITKRVWDNQGITPSQHGFTKGRSFLANLITFSGQAIHLLDKEKAVDIIYPDFSKLLILSPTVFSWGEDGSLWLGQKRVCCSLQPWQVVVVR